MSGPIINSPFNDAVGCDSVPRKGTGRGSYNDEPGMSPKGDAHLLPELVRDTTFGAPKSSGPIKDSPFKDSVE